MKANIRDEKGFVLIVVYIVVAVLIIVSAAFSTRSVGEQRVISKERDSVQAFWLAETGLDRAMSDLPNSPLSGTLGRGAYSTQTTPVSSIRFLINSNGGVPGLDETDPNNIVRKITALVEQPANNANPGEVTSAITAEGEVVVRGSAEVNGNIDEFATFDFEEIFGISKDLMRSIATNLYVDPENNVLPVNAITWSDVTPGNEMIIAAESYWEGDGILVVNGDLRLTGGYFRGIIWVVGELWISGNPIVDGAIFVESEIEFDTIVTGNPLVNYDIDAISDAFEYLTSDLPPFIVNWKED